MVCWIKAITLYFTGIFSNTQCQIRSALIGLEIVKCSSSLGSRIASIFTKLYHVLLFTWGKFRDFFYFNDYTKLFMSIIYLPLRAKMGVEFVDPYQTICLIRTGLANLQLSYLLQKSQFALQYRIQCLFTAVDISVALKLYVGLLRLEPS